MNSSKYTIRDLFVLTFAALAAGMFAAPDRVIAMIPEDILTQKTVQLVDLSSNGRHLLFGIAAWDVEAGRQRTTLYCRDLESGTDLILFTPEDRSRNAVWRPDGEAIAYLRGRGADCEIWLMDSDGGNRHRLSNGPGPFGSLHWSPDGSSLAWIASANVGLYEGVEGSYVVADGIGYRHLGDGYRQGDLRQLFIMDTADGTPVRLLEADLDVRSLSWSPDGQRIVFEAKARRDLGHTVNTDLWIISRQGGEPVKLTTNPGADAHPIWRQDGSIAWLMADDPIWESAPNAIALMDPDKKGQVRIQLHGLDLDNRFWKFTLLGDEFLALVARRGCLDLVRISADGHEYLTSGGHDYWSMIVGGSQVALVGASQVLPGALFMLDLDSGIDSAGQWPRQPEILINPNREWSRRVDLAQPENFSVEVDGRLIDGWYFLPKGLHPGEKVPVVLSIHGGPEWMYGGYFLPEFHILPHFGYGVVIANPTGSLGYGFDFQKAIRGDWIDRPGRELLACLDFVVAEGWADPDRMAVMGGSYGGHLGAALTARTDRFRAAALDRMHPDLVGFWGTTDEKWFPEWEFLGKPWDPEAREVYRRNSPFTFVDKVNTPTLISQGMRDYRCLIAGGETWFSALQSRGVPSRFIRFEEEGHGIRNPANQVFYQQQLLNWFDQHVLGPNGSHQESPDDD
ncbi:MAG: S9 family peptidase [Gemmatimonadales bacterium]|nr:S9 family peptidase [Gemmatimonadales bacterium]